MTIAEFAAALAGPPPVEWDSAGYTEYVGVAGAWTPAPVRRTWPCGCSLTQGLSWHRCEAHTPQRCLWAGCERECSHAPEHDAAMAISEAALRTGDEAGAAAALGWHSIEGMRGGYTLASRRRHEVGVARGRPFSATSMGLRLSGIVLAQRHPEWRISPEEGMAGLRVQVFGGGRACSAADKRILTEQEAILVADWLSRIGDAGSRTGAPLRTYRCWEFYDRCHWHVGHSWIAAAVALPPVRSVGRTRRREAYSDGSVVSTDVVRYSDGTTQAFSSRISAGSMIEILD